MASQSNGIQSFTHISAYMATRKHQLKRCVSLNTVISHIISHTHTWHDQWKHIQPNFQASAHMEHTWIHIKQTLGFAETPKLSSGRLLRSCTRWLRRGKSQNPARPIPFDAVFNKESKSQLSFPWFYLGFSNRRQEVSRCKLIFNLTASILHQNQF